MGGKWAISELSVGQEVEATFWANPVKESRHRYRATHLDGKRAPKVVLSSDRRIAPGVPCIVRITTIAKTARPDRGHIEVELVHALDLPLEGVYVDPVVKTKLQVLLESGLNILLDGPQGCGKTVIARAIADTLGMRFVFFNCSSVIEPTDFLATIQVRASEGGHPVTDFVKTDVLRALEEASENDGERYLVFFDELNRCRESARNALMPALDATRRVFNPIANDFLAIPQNVQFIAAVNSGREFSGTFGVDPAQLDRFAPIAMDYPPPAEERKLLAKRHPELSRPTIEFAVEVAHEIRSAPDLDQGLSVRATDEACLYLKHPLIASRRESMMAEVLKSSYCGRFFGRWNDSSSDAGVVWVIIERKLEERARAKHRRSAKAKARRS